MEYPYATNQSPIAHFIAKIFMVDGVGTFYGINEKIQARNNLTLENFTDIRNKNFPLKLKKKTGEVYDYIPIALKNCKLIAASMNYQNIYCVDIDENIPWEKIPKIFQSCPYSKSRNKQLPHFYFIITDLDHNKLKNGGKFQNASNNLNFCKGELLTSNTWEIKEGLVYNFNGELPVLLWKDVKQFINEAKRFEKQANYNQKPIATSNKVSEICSETTDDKRFENQANYNQKPIATSNKVSEICSETTDDNVSIFSDASSIKDNKAIENTSKKEEAEDKEINKKLITISKLKAAFSKKRLSGQGDFKTGTWKRFTIAMYNSFGHHGKDLWNELSLRGDNYDKSGNEKWWEECVKMSGKKSSKKLDFPSLLSWAREDDLELYNSIFNETNIDWDRLTDYTFALALEKKLVGENINVDYKVVFTGKNAKMDGFLFNGVYWEELGLHNAQIKKQYFAELYKEYSAEFEKVASHYEDAQVVSSIKHNIKSLDSVSKRNNIIEALQTERYVEKIEWNKKGKHLFVFDDCIYNLDEGCFVQPNPNDYINCSCGYKYGDIKKEYKDLQKWIKDEYLESIFEDKIMTEYILRVCSSFLKQENVEEKAYFWLGNGRNSKGTLTKFLMESMGYYFGELKLGFYTNYTKGEDAPNNNLYNLRNARLCNTAETGEDENDPTKPQKFITQKFKTATGGDKQVARQPHEKTQIEFAMGHVLIQTNVMPELVGIHLANNISLQERPEIIPFPFSFVDNPEDSKKQNPNLEYRKRNNALKSKFDNPDMKLAFIRLLLDNYKNYKDEGLKAPKKVEDEKLKYFSQNDIIGIWVRSTLEKSEPDGDEEFNMTLDTKDLLISFQSANTARNKTHAVFLKDLINIVGERDRNNKKTSRGIFRSGNIWLIQGYEWIDKDSINKETPLPTKYY